MEEFEAILVRHFQMLQIPPGLVSVSDYVIDYITHWAL